MIQHLIFMANPEGGGGGPEQLIFLVLILVVFYFFMIRPQMKKAKEQKKFRESIGKGDRIVTVGGIHGKIIDVEDKTFIVEVLDQTRLRVEKTAVSMENTTTLADKK
jgi:preprotein translocase subunit YajC